MLETIKLELGLLTLGLGLWVCTSINQQILTPPPNQEWAMSLELAMSLDLLSGKKYTKTERESERKIQRARESESERETKQRQRDRERQKE